ncbi:MAG: SDR family oxidoreductase [Caldilineaceae bacterium]|nr:SDR family oxidoreductase [Caldilineaceae bacterium]
MSRPLEGKSILITGGSGIGRATAYVCAEQGARLLVADIHLASAEETAAHVQAQGGEAVAMQVDVRDAAQVEAMVAQAVATYGRLDGAFNNAGVLGPVGKHLADNDEDEWHQIIDINLKGVWLCMKMEIRQMLTQGSGSIVNTASVAGLVGTRPTGIYVASKHGVVGLTRSAALQYGGNGIRINAVCPGFVDTPMVENGFGGAPEIQARLATLSVFSRIARPAEIGDSVAWLLSDSASFVTGVPFPVDGGWTAQ